MSSFEQTEEPTPSPTNTSSTVTDTTVTISTSTTAPTFTTTSANNSSVDNNSETSLGDVLQTYQCPFETDSETLCDYYMTHTEGGVCPFGHQLGAPFTSGIGLNELPSYLCVAHLLEDCINPLTEGSVSRLARCTDGLHLTEAELVDSKRLQEMLASEVLDLDARQKERQREVESIIHSFDEDLGAAGSSSSAPLLSADVTSTTTDDDCCSICRTEFTSVAAFGLLDSCDHAFCAGCILLWHNRQATSYASKRCPNCRIGFNRVLLWPKPKLPTRSAEHKSAFFELQSRCAEVSTGQAVRVDDLPEMMERLSD